MALAHRLMTMAAVASVSRMLELQARNLYGFSHVVSRRETVATRLSIAMTWGSSSQSLQYHKR